MDNTSNKAELMAINIVEYIFSNEGLKEEFIRSTGISRSEFPNLLVSPEFLLGALDFLLTKEEKLIQFCSEFGYKPSEPLSCREFFNKNILSS